MATAVSRIKSPKYFAEEQAPPGFNPLGPVAYGLRGIPKLLEEIKGTVQADRQRAITTLTSLFHSPENIAHGLKYGVVEVLKAVVLEPARDLILVQRSMDLFEILSKHAVGRHALISQGVITVVSQQFKDTDEYTRRKSYAILLLMLNGYVVPDGQTSETLAGIDAVLKESDLLQLLLSRLPEERFENQASILSILYIVLRTSIPLRKPKANGPGYELQKKLAALHADPGFHLQALASFMPFLHPYQPSQIKQLAAECLAVVFHNEPVEILQNPADVLTDEPEEEAVAAEESVTATTCRHQAIKDGVIIQMLVLLRAGKDGSSQRTSVQAAVMQALMALAIDVEAKKQIVRDGGAQVVAECLAKCVDALFKQKHADSEMPRLLLFTLKAMANIAEEYRARFAFQQSLPLLQRVVYETQSPLLAIAAKQATKVITWRP